MLAKAESGGFAVLAPDFPSLAVVRFLIEAAEEFQAPLLLSYSPSLKNGRDLHSYRRFIEVVREEASASSASLGLHLDHATRLEDIREAIDLGFSSVMIDASQASWEDNVSITQEVVRWAHSAGVGVESELGHVAISKRYFGISKKEDRIGVLTDPDDAVEFVSLTGVDALAVAVGTLHGEYTGEPRLDFERLASLHSSVPVPLVLHGGSGTGTENLQKAVSLGIRKINVFSDLVRAIQIEDSAVIKNLTAGPNDMTLAKKRAVRRVLEEYLPISGSQGTCPAPVVDIPGRAGSLFSDGYSCSEAIFLSFAEAEGYTSDTAQQICSMFNGGMCNTGGVCGALIGALAVIGARQSLVNPLMKSRRRAARKTGAECINWFEQRFAYKNCKDLLQLDFTDPVQAERYKVEQKDKNPCRVIVEDTARWLLENREIS